MLYSPRGDFMVQDPVIIKSNSRKTMLYKTGVEYGDYTINHVLGCSHGCKYPCYAYMLAKRFGRVRSYGEWCTPVLSENALDIIRKELPRLKDKINSVHLCFTTDPFMYGYEEIAQMSIEIINEVNSYNIPCTALTKGILPELVKTTSKMNSFGITLISLDENFRSNYEPGSAKYTERIESLKKVHNNGYKTWVSIEPYPTPNIIDQDIDDILEAVNFVDRIIFGRLNYNSKVSEFKNYKHFYNELVYKVISFCEDKNISYHIKDGTIT